MSEGSRSVAASDPEPPKHENYYEWLKWWKRQPENQAKARELEQRYIDAMQKDRNLD